MNISTLLPPDWERSTKASSSFDPMREDVGRPFDSLPKGVEMGAIHQSSRHWSHRRSRTRSFRITKST